jgi:hypothetical protein
MDHRTARLQPGKNMVLVVEVVMTVGIGNTVDTRVVRTSRLPQRHHLHGPLVTRKKFVHRLRNMGEVVIAVIIGTDPMMARMKRILPHPSQPPRNRTLRGGNLFRLPRDRRTRPGEIAIRLTQNPTRESLPTILLRNLTLHHPHRSDLGTLHNPSSSLRPVSGHKTMTILPVPLLLILPHSREDMNRERVAIDLDRGKDPGKANVSQRKHPTLRRIKFRTRNKKDIRLSHLLLRGTIILRTPLDGTQGMRYTARDSPMTLGTT